MMNNMMNNMNATIANKSKVVLVLALTVCLLTDSVLAGETCASATTINTDSNVELLFDNAGASLDGSTPCTVSVGADLWFHINSTINGTAHVTTCSDETGFFDTTLQVVTTDDCSTFSCLAENDDDDECGSGDLASTVQFEIVEGESYYVRLSGFEGEVGDGKITFGFGLNNTITGSTANATCGDDVVGSGEQCEPGTHDNCEPDCQWTVPMDTCETPFEIDAQDGSYAFSNVGSEYDGEYWCDMLEGYGVWYSVTPTEDVSVVVSTCHPETGFDTILQVLTTEDCSNSTCVARNDQQGVTVADEGEDEVIDWDALCETGGASYLESRVEFDAEAGQTYRVRVLGQDESRGSGVVSFEFDNGESGAAAGFGSSGVVTGLAALIAVLGVLFA